AARGRAGATGGRAPPAAPRVRARDAVAGVAPRRPARWPRARRARRARAGRLRPDRDRLVTAAEALYGRSGAGAVGVPRGRCRRPPGLPVSNAQLLLAPPLVAALLGESLMRPDRALLGRIALAGSAVALWDLAWFTLVIPPWVTPALREFWRGHYAPLDSASALGAFVYRSGARLLAPALRSDGVLLALLRPR